MSRLWARFVLTGSNEVGEGTRGSDHRGLPEMILPPFVVTSMDGTRFPEHTHYRESSREGKPVTVGCPDTGTSTSPSRT